MAKRFVVYGRVQGVGFRYFTWKEAERIGIKGIVRNCVDGRVEIVAEGNDDQLQDFYNWLKVGPRTASVERCLEDNIEISERYLKQMSELGISLEIELGVTGGEEDGVDNTGVDNALLYTQPADVALAYERLIKISDKFSIAASFGNVHGVYKPGNVVLRPEILKNSQEYSRECHASPA